MTPKQARFVEEYLIDLNATQAAKRAGYSEKTARFIGCENLTKPNIIAAINVAKYKRSMRTEVTVDRVLEELARIAFFRLDQICTWDEEGNVMFEPSEGLSEDVLAALSKLQHVRSTRRFGKDTEIETDTITIDSHAKMQALQLLGKHLGMFTERIQLIDVEPQLRKYAEERGIDPDQAVAQATHAIWGNGD